MKTIEQQRAYFALKCVERIKLLKIGKWLEFRENEFEEIRISSNELPLEMLKERALKGGIIKILWDIAKKEIINLLKSEINPENRISDTLNKFEKGEEIDPAILEKIKTAYSQLSFPPVDFTKDYATHAKKLPQLIVSNGLVPTLAFYKSKGKERMQIYLDLELWLKYKNFIQGNHLLEYFLTSDANWLRVITVESLAFAEWLKRMAEVELKEE